MYVYLGKSVFNILKSIGEVTRLFLDTFKWMIKKPFDKKGIVHQMIHVGYNSTPVTLITSLFIGMVLALQTGLSLEIKLKGASQFIGGVVTVAMVRELAPVLTAIIMAGRIGSSIAAEIGTMKVTEQIDALRTLATNPIHYLSVPRFIALSIMMPVLTLISDLVGWFGGAIVAILELNNTMLTFFYNSQAGFRMGDLYSGLIKSSVFGMIIAIIGCYKGFKASGGAEGVGKATISSVVTSSMLILVSDYFLTSFLNFTLHI